MDRHAKGKAVTPATPATLAALAALAALALAAGMPGGLPRANATPLSGGARLQAVRTAHAPVIDGRLEDAAWIGAPASNAFTQKYPDEGRPPRERTEIRVVYDNDAVYVAIHCEQRESPILKRLTRRDREADTDANLRWRTNAGSADRVTVHIGSRRDRATAYLFGINAAGVLSDGLHFDDTSFTQSWDENWEGRSVVGDNGWSAEMRIPLRALRFDDVAVQDWGFNVRRFVADRQEIDEWAYTPRTEGGVVSRFGSLENLEGLRGRYNIEARPFVVTGAQRVGVPAAGTESWSTRTSAGVDARFYPTQNTTVSATANPDFGQVEADQVVLNLSTFETYLPEKRPFFLEGLEMFDTPKQLLYTRRIGAAPGRPAALGGEQAGAQPLPSAILGALKLTGKPTSYLSVGALSSLTDRNDVSVLSDSATGARSIPRVASPYTASNVLRLKLDLGRNSYIGLMGTGVTRLEQSRLYPSLASVADVTGPDTQLCPSGERVTPGARCTHDAYAAGMDGRWRSPMGNYSASGQLFLTQIVGGPTRTFADGTRIGGGDRDVSGLLNINKDGGNFLWNTGINYTGRRLDYNDLGFMQQQNNAWAFVDLGYRKTQPWWFAQEASAWVFGRKTVSIDGLDLGHRAGVSAGMKLLNLWQLGASMKLDTRRYDQREILRTGAAFERPAATELDVNLESPAGNRVIGRVVGRVESFAGGGALSGDGALSLRAFPRLDLDLLSSLRRSTGDVRYLSRDGNGAGARYLFGDLAAAGLSTTLRATYAATPNLTLQAYGQLFLAFRRYDNFAEFTSPVDDPRIRLAALTPAAAPGTVPDSRSAAVNATVLLRWEYTLGSTLYLVYTRSQVPDSALAPGEVPRLDLGRLRGAPAVDAFMVKLAYWLG